MDVTGECVFCHVNIYPESEMAVFADAESGNLKKAHLYCFLASVLAPVSDRTIQPSDAVVCDVDVCYWCRQTMAVVKMNRTGQKVCFSCLGRLTKILGDWIEQSNLDLRKRRPFEGEG